MSDMPFIEPCRTVPTGPQWSYEMKHDAFRFVAVREGKAVRIYSRGGHDWSERLPAITEALLALPLRSVVLDGERVICAGIMQQNRHEYFPRHARLPSETK